MSDPLGEIGIDEGEETPLREIVAPQEGDDYIESYYEILRTIEQNTVYVGETKSDLETKGDVDWPLVGIAETTASDLEGDSVYIYDAQNSEWNDTFQSVETFVSNIEAELTEELEDVEEDLEAEIETAKKELNDAIEDVQEDIDDLEAELKNDIEDLEQDIDNLDIDDIEDLRDSLEDIEQDLGDLEQDIDNLDIDDIEGLRDSLKDIEQDLGDLEQDIDNLDIDDIEDLRDELDEIKDDVDNIEYTPGVLENHFSDPDNWSSSGPDDHSVSLDDDAVEFSYEFDGLPSGSTKVWEFETTAPDSGEVEFEFVHDGRHSNYQAVATSYVTVDGDETTLKEDDSSTWSFTATGTREIEVNEGDTVRATVEGYHWDRNEELHGTLSLTFDQNDFGVSESAFDGLNDTVDELREDIENLEEDIDSLESSVSSNSSDIDSLESKVDNYNIGSIEGRVEDNEEKVEYLWDGRNIDTYRDWEIELKTWATSLSSGDTMHVSVDVTNHSGSTRSQDINLLHEDSGGDRWTVDSTSYTFDPGETTRIDLTHRFPGYDSDYWVMIPESGFKTNNFKVYSI